MFGCSPRAWGWTDGGHGVSRRGNVFPTRVGMDRSSAYALSRSIGVPHTRGDGPQPYGVTRKPHPYSPQAWGWTALQHAFAVFALVFPTRVGLMNILELHICQSFPVTCVNRDDVGSPKSAVFGGVPRARISSQSLKRAARVYARENYRNIEFVGIRSRRLIEPFVEAFTALGLTESDALEKTEEVRNALSKVDSDDKSMVTTAVFMSPNEINRIAKAVSSGKSAKEAVKNANIVDAADIALFGRMIANDPSINVEAASMFSHALSVHKSTNDLDFFTAVDERYSFEGAASMGTLEFNASIYYRYTGLNIDLLERHLKHMSRDQRVAIVDAFIRSVLLAVPGARRTSMNGDTLPGYALGVAKKGRPLNLSNAFLKPCKPEMDDAVRALIAHHSNLKRVWGITNLDEVTLSETGKTTIEQFVHKLASHVI